MRPMFGARAAVPQNSVELAARRMWTAGPKRLSNERTDRGGLIHQTIMAMTPNGAAFVSGRRTGHPGMDGCSAGRSRSTDGALICNG